MLEVSVANVDLSCQIGGTPVFTDNFKSMPWSIWDEGCRQRSNRIRARLSPRTKKATARLQPYELGVRILLIDTGQLSSPEDAVWPMTACSIWSFLSSYISGSLLEGLAPF